jgi:selenocysteine lyase/cysteine desulfurase
VTIREDALGRVDLDHLDHELRRHSGRLRIGTFSAASNVTGIITDVDAVAALLHRHGALACFDYASAGPYLPIDMAGKDAVFLSPHKFVGGPGTPGVLVAKRALLARAVEERAWIVLEHDPETALARPAVDGDDFTWAERVPAATGAAAR